MDATTTIFVNGNSQASTSFPPGYGDVTLMSNDGVSFSFPSFLLAHSSPHFRAVFDTTRITAAKSKGADVLNVDYDSAVLDQFLRHLDPTKPKAPFDPGNVTSLLDAARQYQVFSILERFKKEIYMIHSDIRETRREAFIELFPYITLSLAYNLGLEECVQHSIREISRCHIDKIKDKPLHLPSDLIQFCEDLRRERIGVYRAIVDKLADHEVSNSGNIKDAATPTCMNCTVQRARWTFRLMTIAVDEPNWNTFKHAYYDLTECMTCNINWANHKKRALTRWMNAVQPEELEGKLPELPDHLQKQLEEKSAVVPDNESV